MGSEILNLFSTPIKTVQVGSTELFRRMSDMVYIHLPPNYEKIVEGSGGCSTRDNLNKSDDFIELYTLIDTEMSKYFNDYLGINSDDVHMTCMWATIQQSGAKHSTHIHPNSFYSGVIYLNIPEEEGVVAGNISFIDPRQAKNMWVADWKKEHGLTHRAWSIEPKTGLLILFPSWLEHGTDVYITNTNEHRISLSFNYMLDKCSLNTLKLK